ncbi:MAG: carbamoyl transferase [Proteobacteria bacterium]|nr:carbamoyl transferase [Pseudomonadota bacterium]
MSSNINCWGNALKLTGRGGFAILQLNSMNILGLHTFGHDTGAALISGGRLLAIGEERLDRAKHSGAFPHKSIRYLLGAAGLKDIEDIDLIVGVTRIGKDGRNKEVEMIRSELSYGGPIQTVSHHTAHAAGAFYPSPFDEATVMVVDGLGSNAIDYEAEEKAPFILIIIDAKIQKKMEEVQSFYRAMDGKLFTIRKDYSMPGYRNGIGLLYMGTSVFLGMGDFGSGKVMGLAPYGESGERSFRKNFCEIVDGAALIPSEKNFVRYNDCFQKLFYPDIPQRKKERLPDDVYTQIAFEVQDALEEALVAVANHLYRISPSKNLCYAGGVGLNSVANKKILDNTPFENIFIQPGACDSGIALGCALYGAHVINGEDPKKYRFKNAYLGRSYSEEEVLETLKNTPNIRFTKEKDLFRKAAKLLADGKILGWFEGGSEIGPRALGHRSIICDPGKPEMKDILNEKVKHREGFRPFAPSVLREYVSEYFDLACESPYMLLIAGVKEDKQKVIPAITHVDGTARVQTVTREDNGRYYDLIHEFFKITGVPVILNTSFNVAGEPIVETPAEALKCFMSTEMDCLVIEDYLIEASGPKKLVSGPMVDEDKLRATDFRGGFRRYFSNFFKSNAR